MHTVYRVELPDGSGPYVGLHHINMFHPIMSTHIVGTCEKHSPPKEIADEQVCGFESMEQLNNWFEGCLDWLFSRGYVISEYQVSDYEKPDDYQILFVKDNLHHIEGECG